MLMPIKDHLLSVCLILFLKVNVIPKLTESYTDNCKIDQIALTNNKVLCEALNGLSVSCLDPSVTKAYVQCESSYYNPGGQQLQTLQCTSYGFWSNIPLDCLPECSENSKAINKEQIIFPTSYVEVVYKSPKKVNPKTFSAIILNEQMIMVKSDFVNYHNENDHPKAVLSMRFAKSKGNPVEITLSQPPTLQPSSDAKFAYMYMTNIQPIKFDGDTKPVCNLGQLSEVDSNSVILYKRSEPIRRYNFNNKCVMPSVETSVIEVKCFDSSTINQETFEHLTCTKLNRAVATRCQIGYRDANQNEDDELLSLCYSGDWRIFAENDNCELICGEIKTPFKPLIFVGNPTESSVAPWHVGIYANNTELPGFQQICGGSIIHSNIVLTAAHCFHNDDTGKLHHPEHFLVGAGKTFRSFDLSEKYEMYKSIRKIAVPFNFQSDPLLNDLAVVFIKDHFKFKPNIQPICIDLSPFEKDPIKKGVEGRIFGWGATSLRNNPSDRLLETDLTAITNDECRAQVKRSFRSQVTAERFCAQNERNSTACQGDSGGGFVIEKMFNGKYRYMLTGIISAGLNLEKYCNHGFITVFTNVHNYKDFIKSAISEYRDEDFIKYLNFRRSEGSS